jgi:hypothetical protein
MQNKDILLERLTRLEEQLKNGMKIVEAEKEHVERSFSDSYLESYLSAVMNLSHRTEILLNDIRTTL